MRKLKATVCLFFVAACIIFGIYIVKSRMVEDHTPPVITCEEDTISVSVKAEDSELLAGVTAKDNKDGDITESVCISSMSHFIKQGKRTVTYVVFDKANQVATAERTLIYTDYTSPRIHLTKPLRYTVRDLDSAKITENMTAEDCIDGDLTGQIHTTWNTSLYDFEAGVHSVTAQVSNSAGDVCMIPLEVEVIDNADKTEAAKYYPMLSEYIAYAPVGGSVNPSEYLIGIVNGNEEYKFGEKNGNLSVRKENVVIKSNVDYSKPGVYTVDYTYTSKDGTAAVTKLFVVVEE